MFYAPAGTRLPGILLALLVFALSARAGLQFTQPARLTESASQTRLSRTTAGNLAATFDGAFHLVYTEWPESAAANVQVNTPDEPSRIFYRQYAQSQWTAPMRINHGTLPDGREIGGGHPSIVTRPGADLYAFWHDARHTTQSANWINNYELYTSTAPFDGPDARFTETSAGHNGDNGYSPQAAIGPDSRVWVAWFDFTADFNVSDIYVRTSDLAGNFPPGAMADWRKTTYVDGSGRTSFWHPSIAVDGAGLAHVVWTEGFALTTPQWLLTLSATGEVMHLEEFVATGSNNLDPPHLVSAPNGDVYAAWSDRRHGNGEIYIAHLPAGATRFAESVRLSMDDAVSQQPDLAVDSAGTVHVVWADNRDRAYDIYYRSYRFGNGAMSETRRLSSTAGRCQHPAISVGPAGDLLIVYEDETPGNAELFTVRGLPFSSVAGWEAYR